MKLQWFEVHGYKNIRSPLRLDELGPINVLHGDNNVGKSNLLESLALFYLLIRTLGDDAQHGPKLTEQYDMPEQVKPGDMTSTIRSFNYFSSHGFEADGIFHFLEPKPISLRASIRLDSSDVHGNAPGWMTEPLTVSLRAERKESGIAVTMTELRQADGIDLCCEPKPFSEAIIAAIRGVLDSLRRRSSKEPRFLLVRADRTALSESNASIAEQTPLMGREPLPRDLAEALYDAAGSSDTSKRRRFKRFIEILVVFRDLVGPGEWRAWYDRESGRADLRLEVDDGHLLLRAMGSGIQQIVNLVARAVMSGADVVAIEEPELNLRYDAQLRLREILQRLVDDGVFAQLFLASHSSAFQLARTFHAILRSPSGPRVEQISRGRALRFTGPEVDMPPEDERAPISYVTAQGLVRLPDDIRDKLLLKDGGGVVFVGDKDGYVRMLTDNQFCDLFDSSEETS